MAPMTRSTAAAPRADLLFQRAQASREPSWQFVGQPEMDSEREESAEPASSYDETSMRSGDDYAEEEQEQPESPEDNEDILHPLREAANRVGREVERFAEVLDQYNPLRATGKVEKYEMSLELIDSYHEIAVETFERLKEYHAAAVRKAKGRSFRKKFQGFKIVQEEDEMIDLGDDDGMDFPDQQTTLDDLERWEEEVQTWDLLRRLVDLRYPHPESAKGNPKRFSPQLHRYSTEREIWDNFLEVDGLALERKTVLDWLKNTAEESGEDIDLLVRELQQKADRGEIVAHGWIHTKNAIKQRKRLQTWTRELDQSSAEVQRVHMDATGMRPLITHLDPDAATRQKRNLEAQDEYFERAIWQGCFELLRRGTKPAQVREWLVERSQVWKAVSMAGFPHEKSNDEQDEPGNPASDALWKRMCFALAKNGAHKYERAVYGVLSGDIDSVLHVCETWDDFMFAHYNALLRTQFDNYIQKLYVARPPTFEVFDAIQYHGDPSATGKRLVDSLKRVNRTKHDSLKPMKMLQGVLIANHFDHFVYQQGLALSKSANNGVISNVIPLNDEQLEEDIERYIAIDDHDSLRVVAHMLLAFISLGLELGGPKTQVVIENVIVSYVTFLRLAGKEELIPLYCSQLSGNRRYATLSRNLIDVTDHEQRQTQIRLMRELGLDVRKFVTYQSRYLFADYPDNDNGYPATGNFKILEDDPEKEGERRVKRDFFGLLGGDDVERKDTLMIRSLEWFLLVDGLWSETFEYGTLLYLRFFKEMHLNAARTLAGKVPSSAIAQSKTGMILGRSQDFKSLEFQGEDEDLTEVIGESAEYKHILKKHLAAEARSFRELEAFTEFLDSMESATSSFDLLHEHTDAKWQRGWRRQLAEYIQTMKDSVQPVLKEWLLTSQQEGAQDEFKLLREAYLPEAILAYISTLQVSGRLLSRDLIMECMDLSSLIAAEDSDMLDSFVQAGRVGELITFFAQAGQELLILTSQKTTQSKSKKLKTKGWTPELWSVKV